MNIVRWARTGAWVAAAMSAACGGSVAVERGGTAGSGGASSTTGSGGARVCSGVLTCAAGEYCDYPAKSCGDVASGGLGTCAPRPASCPPDVDPTCGCDHHVYDNACEAEAAGVDVQVLLGGCTAPAGTFGCGAHFCTLGAAYCQVVALGGGPDLDTYQCVPLPASCGASPSCACLSAVMCGTDCMTSLNGGLQVFCSAG